MTTIVRHDNVAAIPPEIADAFGIKEGTRLEWTDAGGGMIAVKPLASRGERARALLGAGRRWLKAGQDPVADLLRERAAEDSTNDSSARYIGLAGTPPG
jgi:bifunctional DNA-binding transcriptional regulator/antitoxin component of YhaV-PrlF toxin-antitoxin module